MKIIKKAVAIVLRSCGNAKEVLVFRHPLAGVQIPKGTVEDNETIEAATLRELKEESGLILENRPNIIGALSRTVKGGQNEDGPLEINEWHIGILQASTDVPDHWLHEASGSSAEKGLTFEFFWITIDETLPAKLHPLFAETAKIIIKHQNIKKSG